MICKLSSNKINYKYNYIIYNIIINSLVINYKLNYLIDIHIIFLYLNNY